MPEKYDAIASAIVAKGLKQSERSAINARSSTLSVICGTLQAYRLPSRSLQARPQLLLARRF